jgi:signal transduction histidine kinase
LICSRRFHFDRSNLALSIRPKLFLTLAAFCITPPLVLSLVSFVSGLNGIERLMRQRVEDDAGLMVDHCTKLVADRELDLQSLANGLLPNYVRNATTPESIELINDRNPANSGAALETARAVRQTISSLTGYSAIACFDPNKGPLFLTQADDQFKTYRTRDFLPGSMAPDDSVWSVKEGAVHNSLVQDPTYGAVWRCTLPIFLTQKQDALSHRGALVANIRLDQIFSSVDGRKGFVNEDAQLNRRLLVLDNTHRIIYQQNQALRNQAVEGALPHLASLAAAMTARNEPGNGEYRTPEGDTWVVAYRPVLSGLSLAVARNYSQASRSTRRAGWLGVTLAVVLGSVSALLLSVLYQRRSQSLDRVTESVAAIAEGKLDQELLLRSSDDMRGLADGVNRMTERLRDQLAREAETRQFDSFARLSSMLAHDLKNAIEGISLLVGNMERHFDNPRFRADAMHALATSTDKLRTLVARLSNPINTLSGEFKVPRPTDLVPLLQRVLAQIAEPQREQIKLDVRLPASLFALADAGRIEKVMENLVLNAVEAMAGRDGQLTIEAGPAGEGKVFFSVADTGPGMTAEFIKQKLFRPFSTTKVRGVGLGLYTCREVIRANNGAIEVKSQAGSGTTFRVVLASAQLQ